MKTKLLKKVRRRFEINYYPHQEKPYVAVDKHQGEYEDWFWVASADRSHMTKDSAIKAILQVVRCQYKKHSRREKLKLIKHKVWYNG